MGRGWVGDCWFGTAATRLCPGGGSGPEPPGPAPIGQGAPALLLGAWGLSGDPRAQLPHAISALAMHQRLFRPHPIPNPRGPLTLPAFLDTAAKLWGASFAWTNGEAMANCWAIVWCCVGFCFRDCDVGRVGAPTCDSVANRSEAGRSCGLVSIPTPSVPSGTCRMQARLRRGLLPS